MNFTFFGVESFLTSEATFDAFPDGAVLPGLQSRPVEALYAALRLRSSFTAESIASFKINGSPIFLYACTHKETK